MTDYSIDPSFSVYKLAERRQDISTVISHRETMSKVSYIIEDTARTDHVDNVIFSGFQYMSKFVPQINRYREIAQYAGHVYVFGVPDVELPEIPNISYVDITPRHQLAKEWFIVSQGKDLCTALVTEEVSQISDPDHERRFNGFWIFNDQIVQIMHEWLANEVNAREVLSVATDTESEKHHELTQNLASRFSRILFQGIRRSNTVQELKYFQATTIAPLVS